MTKGQILALKVLVKKVTYECYHCQAVLVNRLNSSEKTGYGNLTNRPNRAHPGTATQKCMFRVIKFHCAVSMQMND